jgi:O-antigen/teichoic acid export membrane protein
MKILSLIKDKILKSEFNRNVLILAGGTAVAQAVPILISPILTRLYTPEDFGALAVFISITSIVGVIVNGRYELAIMLPEKDEDAINVAAVAFLFNVFVSGLFFLFILFFGDWLLEVLNAQNLGKLIYLAPLAVFLIGVFNILKYTNNRFKLYKDIQKRIFINPLQVLLFKLLWDFLNLEPWG